MVNDTASPPQDQQVIQVLSFTILNDSKFESRFSKEGRRWQKAMRTIQQQDGWVRTLYGLDMNAFHRVDIYIGKSTSLSTNKRQSHH